MLGGFPLGASLDALVSGAVGSTDAVLSATLVRATPLLLTGLAVTLAFRSGVLNIGAEGQLLVGAAAAATLGRLAPVLGVATLPIEIVASVLTGTVWALIPALLRQRRGVKEVISTIMMNFLAVFLVSFLVRGPLQEPTRIYPQSSALDVTARFPPMSSGTRLHWGFVLALVLALVLDWGMRHTAAGFRIGASGANARAAAEAGRIDVPAVTMRVFLVSGALAGLAGGVELTGVTFALYENISPGYGYTAIAVALLAGLRPLFVIPSSILFGALGAGAAAMQRDAAVPAGFVEFLQAAIVLVLLATPEVVRRSGWGRRARQPSSLAS